MSTRDSDPVPMSPVAFVRSSFHEKFGIPRQSGLVAAATGEVHFVPPYDRPEMLEGLDGFSHVWLIYVFDANVARGWRPRVRPPRLGGNRAMGVWATRSPYRPNPIGLSAVRLLDVVFRPRPLLRVAGLDLLDGTPVLDIKPYLPYTDAPVDAHGGFADASPQPRLVVTFGDDAAGVLRALGAQGARLRTLIHDVLALDPRPAYRNGAEPGRSYGMRLGGYDVRWSVDENGVRVDAVIAEP